MATVTNEAIGELVRARRLAKKVSQQELADAVGVTMMMVQHYETGRSALTVVKLAAIADKLGCRITALIP